MCVFIFIYVWEGLYACYGIRVEVRRQTAGVSSLQPNGGKQLKTSNLQQESLFTEQSTTTLGLILFRQVHYVAQAGLEVNNLLTQLVEYWD